MKFPQCRLGLVVAALTVGMGSRLAAQEVIVSEPGWFESKGAPDTPPRAKRALRAEFPRDLREAHNSDYVIVVECLDAKGEHVVMDPRGTLPWYQQSVLEALPHWKLSPALNAGKPVASWFWIAVIFNPAGVDPSLPDAPPRLLAVTPVVVAPAVMKRLREHTTTWGTVNLDEAGQPLRVALEPPVSDELTPLVEAALKQWRFAPARREGHPVPGEIRVPFQFFPPDAALVTKQKPARVKSQTAPVFPYAMRASGLIGEVTVAFEIDKTGSVKNPVVARSNNPGFDEAAIEAVMKWKFEPGTVDGRPVSTRMRVPIIFQFSDSSGTEPVSLTPASRRDQAKLPEEMKVDVPPKPRGYAEPVFPYPLLSGEKTGKASVVFEIGTNGKVCALKIITADPPECGLALAAAVETYEFDPALKDGHAAAAAAKTEKDFTRFDRDNLVTREDVALLRKEAKHPEEIVSGKQLDSPVQPKSLKKPQFPVSLTNVVDHGEAVVELLIDEDGHARLPRIVSASQPAFGYAAVQAAARWLFEPPKLGGKPVVVRVRVPFDFKVQTTVLGTGVGAPPEPANSHETK